MDFPIENGDFYSYVSLPEGMYPLRAAFQLERIMKMAWNLC